MLKKIKQLSQQYQSYCLKNKYMAAALIGAFILGAIIF
jgi:hypothetical protein